MVLNQMFSAENFREIFDRENRKGIDVGGRFFPSLEPLTKAFLDCRKKIRSLRSKQNEMSAEDYRAAMSALRKSADQAKRERSQAIDSELAVVSERVRSPKYRITLQTSIGPRGTPVYRVDDSAESFFVSKQLQRNLRQVFRVRQAGRTELASQVMLTLSGSFGLEYVRTDVSRFYESIDRRRLLAELDTNPILSASSKRFIKQILLCYQELSGSDTGIPRGVGISAYLAELYLQPLDRSIHRLPGLTLYCRYVDDIVAAFARPPIGSAPASYVAEVSRIVEESGLRPNLSKTRSAVSTNGKSIRLDYLGYRFVASTAGCKAWPSRSKITKYRKRMEAVFSEYERARHVNSRRAYRQLVARIRFLTGNTRLTNNKGVAATGIYFNNPLVSETSSFKRLDRLLSRHTQRIKRKRLRDRLREYSFVDGFEHRRMRSFSTHQMGIVVRAWKHV